MNFIAQAGVLGLFDRHGLPDLRQSVIQGILFLFEPSDLLGLAFQGDLHVLEQGLIFGGLRLGLFLRRFDFNDYLLVLFFLQGDRILDKG